MVTRLIFVLVVSEKKTVQVKGKGRCIYDLWSCMHVDVLLAYERTESGTHGELGSHISVFCLEPLTIGGRSSAAVEHCLCVCLLFLFLKKTMSFNQTLLRKPITILVRLKPHSGIVFNLVKRV